MVSNYISDLHPAKFLAAVVLLVSTGVGLKADALSDAIAALRRGDFNLAEQELRSELKIHPSDAQALALLGVVLDNEKKFSEAEAAYVRALELSKNSPAVLNNYGNHLVTVGYLNAARPVFQRLLSANPQHRNANLQLARIALERQDPAKALDYLGHIAEAEQRAPDVTLLKIEALYLAKRAAEAQKLVEALAPAAQNDPRLASSLALALVDAHQYAQAGAFFHNALALTPRAEYVQAVTEIANNLLEQAQYKEAADLLNPSSDMTYAPDLQIALAIATAHTTTPQSGLKVLDKISVAQRTGEYYLARSQMLDAAGQPEQAAAALHDALRATPDNPALYRQTVLFLVKNDRLGQAVALAAQAASRFPNDKDTLLFHATILELAQKTDEAKTLLTFIEHRWPSWPDAWLAHGIILETYKQYDQAHEMIEKAISLGAQTGEAYFYLAESTLNTAPDRLDAAEKDIRLAVSLAPQDPWVRTLAGRIAFRKKRYEDAVDELQNAIRLRPNLVQAHYILAQTYKAMGKTEQSQHELEQVSIINQKFPNEEADTSDVKRALFAVRPIESH